MMLGGTLELHGGGKETGEVENGQAVSARDTNAFLVVLALYK